jgi:hypothetical protein
VYTTAVESMLYAMQVDANSILMRCYPITVNILYSNTGGKPGTELGLVRK